MKRSFFCVALVVLNGCGGSGSDTNSNNSGNSTSAAACFNADLNAIGADVTVVNTRVVNGQSEPNYTERDVVSGQVTYEGYTNAREVLLYDDSVVNKAYIVSDESQQYVITLGQIIDGEEIIYKPNGIQLDYNLRAGETREYPTVSVLTNGTQTATYDISFTFEKNETITVPAGEFNTCLMTLTFDVVENGVSTNAVFTQNIGVSNGLMIREETNSTAGNSTFTEVNELVSATINGETVQ
ncbi:hypothetical protein BCT30_14615 [Enterovibrio norvegicus]|uniref:hypothetical protein n=1 Tax=Enterovibrio norvegicus TaxID=188144 RepID=UPI000C85D591|nr:hypothetical protein [Enterovibrio norvegicus]MCC4798245.1 hypothetical protein [Enterovibrio norvegicus]PMH66003.1 hypothetical protein BCU62_10310 [Enterovibrio norvegicus]PMI30477.1 hypothetical protein BCU47_17585 [Enterovibrio norvegicus]PMI38686.1 hypothetical protein BCU46_01520 [Enterovibrio norvegicus]PMN51953.1 hypothetical protein BCT30_14615 [Enterovibrio norvegicus]